MGKKDKKANSKKISLQDDDMSIGDASEASIDTIELAGGAEELEVEESEEASLDRGETDRSKIGAAIDGIMEKRVKTRESSLRDLTNLLQMAHSSHAGSLSGYSETLDTAITGCLNRGGMEGVYAANLLSVMFVVLGQTSYGSDLWAKVSRKLRLIGNKRDLEESKECAASAAAFLSYATGLISCGSENDIDEVEAALELCSELASGRMNTIDGSVSGHVSAEVRTVAFQNWGFLAGSIPVTSRAVRCSTMLPHVVSILAIEGGEYDVDLRNEAGQLAALMSEIIAEAKQLAQDNGEEFFGGGGDVEHWESIRSSLHHLSNDSSKKLSKTAKKEQHATFRRYLRSVDEFSNEGSSDFDCKSTPNATVSFQGGKVTCENWLEYCKLAQLRRVLSGGLPDHLSMRDGVAALIMTESLEVEDADEELNVEIKGKNSAKVKEKMAKRGKERSNRQQEKNSFFEEE